LGRSTSQLRAALETEYRQASPQIAGAAIALLEPQGRAWFYVNEGQELWGYDGKAWIERKASLGSIFRGRCPTRGELPENYANRSAGGKAWFRDSQGIHVFDGQSWNYSYLCPRLDSQDGQLRFAVSPNGRFAVALPPKITQRPTGFQNVELWTLADGKWQYAETPWIDSPGTAGPFCVTDKGVLWYVWTGGVLRRLALTRLPGDSVQEQVTALVGRLDDDQFDTRQQATDALIELEEYIEPQLQAARAAARSSEARTRLDAVLRLRQEHRETPDKIAPDSPGTRVGQCRVRNVKSLFQDNDGRLFVFAEAITRGSQPPVTGVAIVEPGGQTKILPLENHNAGVSYFPIAARGPIQTPAGDALWLSTSTFAGPVRRIDLTRKQVDERAADMRFGEVQAVADRGRVFIGVEPNALGLSKATVGLFREQAAESRQVLVPRIEKIAWPEFEIASDGALWALRQGDGVARFDGERWQPLYKPEERLYPTLAGQTNVMLCRYQEGYALFKDDQYVAHGPLRQLIADHRDTIAAAFPPAHTSWQHQARLCISTDSGGNIWLVERYRLAVLVDRAWLEADEPLKAAGAAGGGRFVSTIGGGSKVYLSDMALAHQNGKSFFGQIVDGKIVLQEAPHGYASAYLSYGVRDPAGALWFPCATGESRGNNLTQITGYSAARLGDEGVLSEVKGAFPVLVDAAGNVWLVEMQHAGFGKRLSIWREDKVAQELELPARPMPHGMFSDRPGSMYLRTTLGLHHLVADNEGRGNFAVKETYELQLPARWTGAVYSPRLGYIISLLGGAQTQLAIFNVPEK
jgi:hypothetical protein